MKLKPKFVIATPTMQDSIEFRMRIKGSENWNADRCRKEGERLGKLFEASEELLEAAKEAEAILARTEANQLQATRAFESERRALCALRNAITKTEGGRT